MASGDICAEWLAFLVPPVAIGFGGQIFFADKVVAGRVLDYIFAYLFGIVFQYFTIAPMSGLNCSQGIWAAIKADTLSLRHGRLECMELWPSPVFGSFVAFSIRR